jgi:hypothetical protein
MSYELVNSSSPTSTPAHKPALVVRSIEMTKALGISRQTLRFVVQVIDTVLAQQDR